jgi:hypothetical protein
MIREFQANDNRNINNKQNRLTLQGATLAILVMANRNF